MSNKKLNVAIVGCGYWGPNLVRNFSSLSDECQVTLVCDQDPQRLKHMQKLYPWVRTTQSFDDVADSHEIDLVAIVTPVSTHHWMAKRCLQAGKHTFIEKPMARSTAECAELVDLAESKGLVLMVGHTFIYSSPVRYTKGLIAKGELGKVQYIASRRLNLGLFQKDINVAWDLAPHDLSIILYLLESDPVGVNCSGVCQINGQEDVINMSIRFADGSYATIHNSWLDPNKVREMTIVGTNKMVHYDDNQPNEKIKIYDKRVVSPPHYDTFAEFQYSYHYGDMITPYIPQAEPLKVEAQHLIDCIRKNDVPMTSGRDGMRVVQILEASSLSLKNGGGYVKLDSISSKPAKSVPVAEQALAVS